MLVRWICNLSPHALGLVWSFSRQYPFKKWMRDRTRLEKMRDVGRKDDMMGHGTLDMGHGANSERANNQGPTHKDNSWDL